MTEVPSAMLLTAAVVTWMRAFRHEDAARGVSRAAIRRLAAPGICLGLLALTRPSGLVVIVLLAISEAIRESFRGSQGTGQRWRFLLPVVIAGILIAPWVARNLVQFQRFIPATTHGGYTLALGNNTAYYNDVIRAGERFWPGEQLAAWQQAMIDKSASEGIDAGSEPAMDRWMYQQALIAIRGNPIMFAKACLYRIGRFWSVQAVHSKTSATPEDNADGVNARQLTLRKIVSVAASITFVWYSLLWTGLAVALFDCCCKTSRYSAATMWLMVAGFLAIHTFYWTDTRMRAPLMPILSVLALTGWFRLMSLPGARRLFAGKRLTEVKQSR